LLKIKSWKVLLNNLFIVVITLLVLVSLVVAHPINENTEIAPELLKRGAIKDWFNNLGIVKTIRGIKEKQAERQEQMNNILNGNY